MISAFDIFKIGIGPSASHTFGPMTAAKRFRDGIGAGARRVQVELFGSLAWTCRGHGTDNAVCLGLLGETPAAVNVDQIPQMLESLAGMRQIELDGGQTVGFNPSYDLIPDITQKLPRHSNGMRFRALAGDGSILMERVFYSVGGGFVVEEGEIVPPPQHAVPFPFSQSRDLIGLCDVTGLTIADIQVANELVLQTRDEVERGLQNIRDAMFASIDRGLRREGELPGRLRVARRAKGLHAKLLARRRANEHYPHEIMDWVSTYAIAVNEENAAGGKVVTAPTNGAAGIIPAVLRYYREFCSGSSEARTCEFLLTAAAIGSLIKRNASISGAEVGCQGEIGSAASMAAAALAAVLGGTPRQAENAAEIALEHHLGMTCDPVEGLVQIPCIERNAIGANKAIAAASLALKGDGVHRVSLDEVIETMRQTGVDMQSKYKETAQGGLAVNVSDC